MRVGASFRFRFAIFDQHNDEEIDGVDDLDDDDAKQQLFEESRIWAASLNPKPWKLTGGTLISPDGERVNVGGGQSKTAVHLALTSLNLTNCAVVLQDDIGTKNISKVRSALVSAFNEKHVDMLVGARGDVLYFGAVIRPHRELYIKPLLVSEYLENNVQGLERKKHKKVLDAEAKAHRTVYKIGRTGQGENKRAQQQRIPLGAGTVRKVLAAEESKMENDINNLLKSHDRLVGLLNNDRTYTNETMSLTVAEHDLIVSYIKAYESRKDWETAFKKLTREFGALQESKSESSNGDDGDTNEK